MRAMVSYSEGLAGSAPGSWPNAAHTVPTQVLGGRPNAAAYWVNLNGACARTPGLRPTIRVSEGLSAFIALDATGEAAYDPNLPVMNGSFGRAPTLLPVLTPKRLGIGTIRNWNTVRRLSATRMCTLYTI